MLLSPIHLAQHRSAVVPLLLRCRTAIAMLSLRCCSNVAPLLHRCCSAVAPPLSLHCCAAVAPLSHRYSSTVPPLLLLLVSLRSRTAITPLSLRCCRSCCRYAFAPAIASDVAPLSHPCRSAIVSVTPLPLMLLLLSQ